MVSKLKCKSRNFLKQIYLFIPHSSSESERHRMKPMIFFMKINFNCKYLTRFKEIYCGLKNGAKNHEWNKSLLLNERLHSRILTSLNKL